MNKQRRRPRAIAITRAEEDRSQIDRIALAAVFALFAIAAFAALRSF